LVKSEPDFYDILKSFSPFERYPYYQDQLPTVPYIKSSLETSHEITEYNVKNRKVATTLISGLIDNLNFYKPEDYRVNIYPYNSDLYLSYLGLNKLTPDFFNFNSVLQHKLEEGFIASIMDPKAWVNQNFAGQHLFSNKLKINKTNTHIINTIIFS
jgi:hypothetical protein